MRDKKQLEYNARCMTRHYPKSKQSIRTNRNGTRPSLGWDGGEIAKHPF
jgi:hypothetical protein